jgi:predicted Fe-S protein YdhL (DUF1289 family)
MGRMSVAAKPKLGGEQADNVPSPCISVCVLDAAGVLCVGCYRTLDEIAAWSVLDADAKRRVLATLPARRKSTSPE